MKHVSTKPLFVTQPGIPPLREFLPYLKEIWASKILTNGGHQHLSLEAALTDYLEVSHISLVSNGTLGLLLALRALNVTGEVITTPYSFVATSNALLWNQNTPVFVDINPETLNIDPSAIEAAITPRTSAILAVHCYGHPCEDERIRQIADKHGLRVIYDAAHAFGVKQRGSSILRMGDLSVVSFHATKVFNTFEGGAVICADECRKMQVDRLKNFGFVDELTVEGQGINAKMNEVSAAFGLLQLKYIEYNLRRRTEVAQRYLAALKDIPGLHCVQAPSSVVPNHSYFPIRVGKEFGFSRDQMYDTLKTAQIFARRYFYPLITHFPMYRGLPSVQESTLPHASTAAREILCLPIYPDLAEPEQDRVIETILNLSRRQQ